MCLFWGRGVEKRTGISPHNDPVRGAGFYICAFVASFINPPGSVFFQNKTTGKNIFFEVLVLNWPYFLCFSAG